MRVVDILVLLIRKREERCVKKHKRHNRRHKRQWPRILRQVHIWCFIRILNGRRVGQSLRKRVLSCKVTIKYRCKKTMLTYCCCAGIFRARKNYEESDNLFISYTRAFTDRVSDAFGKCIRPKRKKRILIHFCFFRFHF